MRILITNANGSVVGGIETYLRALLPRLHASGNALSILTDWPPVSPADTLWSGVPVEAYWSCSEHGTQAAIRAAADWRPDVVFHNGMSNTEADAALVERFPVVFYAHVYYGTCISGTKCQITGPRPCNRQFGLACLGLYLPRRCGGLNPLTMLKDYRSQKRRLAAVRRASSVLTASRHMRDECVRHGISSALVHHVPYFTPEISPDPNPPPQKARTDRILFLGRITALKGWRELLDAVPLGAGELGRALTLVVVGDGPDRMEFETETRRRGIKAEFLGWLGMKKLEAEMRAADLLAVPSIWPEPFGLVGIEAGCVGLPAVGFAVGGIPEWLIPGVSGEIAPGVRPNPKDLAAAIVRAMSDENHLQRLRIGAWQTAQRFSPDAHMSRLIPILEAAAQ
jgi:glycosyltransferase involved in cell wall biosynthesis